jgi:hypothetical protein
MSRAPIAFAAALGVVALASRPHVARADDSKDVGDTIASTWSGGALRLSEQDKRFYLAASTLFAPGIRIRAELSAPLDDATRQAVFLDRKSGLAPGFRGGLFVGYDWTWRALAHSIDERIQTLCHGAAECTGSQEKAARDKEEGIQREARLQRTRGGQPLSSGVTTWSLGMDLAFAYDSQTAFVSDVGDSDQTRDFPSSDLQLGAAGIVVLPKGWAFTGRLGYDRAHAVQFGTFRRCTTLHSSDPMVSGQVCSDQRYLVRDGGVSNSAYARASAAYYPSDGVLARYLSATELRLNFESLTTNAASLDIHLLAFARGVTLASTGVRIGVGTTVRSALVSTDETRAGEIVDYSLFGIVGTSF